MAEREYSRHRESFERFGVSCDWCKNGEYDYDAYNEHWFRVRIPHRDIEDTTDVSFCMPSANFCSVECFAAFGAHLSNLQREAK